MNKIKIEKKKLGEQKGVQLITLQITLGIQLPVDQGGNLYPDDAMETERLVVFLNTTTHRNNASKDF